MENSPAFQCRENMRKKPLRPVGTLDFFDSIAPMGLGKASFMLIAAVS